MRGQIEFWAKVTMIYFSVSLLFSFAFIPKSMSFLKGDINNDDKIDIVESIHSLQVVAGLKTSVSNNIINVPADIPTIQQAIDSASEGDTINISAGNYNETITISSKINYDRKIRLASILL